MKFLIFAVGVLLFASPEDSEDNKAKIARALSAGPAEITNNARVVDTDEPERSAGRLALVDATRISLANALALLGISAPEAM